MSPGSRDQPRTDGRAARRERGRQAVVDATLDLLLERGRPPTPELIVERAGVSMSSLFRYVDGLAELQFEAMRQFRHRYGDLFELPAQPGASLADRIAGLVQSRLRLYATVAPVARVVRARAIEVPILAAALADLRSTQLAQVRSHFAPELTLLSPIAADDAAHSVAALTSFEVWDQQQAGGDRDSSQIERAWRTAVTALLS